MKKIIYVLLAACLVGLLSSCVVVEPHRFREYDFTFNNNTDDIIGDWFLKDDHDNNYSKRGKEANRVLPGCKDTMHDIEYDDYRLYFSYSYNPDYTDYYKTKWFTMDDDTEFRLSTERFYDRSAVSVSTDSADEGKLYLIDSNGNTIELIKVDSFED